MVYYKNNEWHLSGIKVRFTDNNEETTKPVGSEGKGWWNELAKKHDDIKIIEFIEAEQTPEELNRLKEINSLNIPDGFSSVLAGYVKSGTFPDKPNHVLKDLDNRVAHIGLGLDQTVTNMETLNALTITIQQTQVEQANQHMEIMDLISQLQGGK